MCEIYFDAHGKDDVVSKTSNYDYVSTKRKQ